MARNLERDAREEERRRKQILNAGFKLFSEKGIETVSLESVSIEAEVGVATIYKYYQNKVNLVVAISAAVWEQVWTEAISKMGQEKMKSSNSYQFVEAYIDCIFDVYKNNPEILRFSGDYKTFICRECRNIDEVAALQLNALKPIVNLFHECYERAKIDGSIRTDIPENELFTTIVLTTLGMAERYSQGLVWAKESTSDYSKELGYLKEMILGWVSKK